MSFPKPIQTWIEQENISEIVNHPHCNIDVLRLLHDDFPELFHQAIQHRVITHINIHLKDILSEPEWPWDLHEYSSNHNITIQEIRDHPNFPWDSYLLYANSELKPEELIEIFPLHAWAASWNPRLTWEFVKCQGLKHDWFWFELTKIAPIEFIMKNLDLDWSGQRIAEHPKLTIDYLLIIQKQNQTFFNDLCWLTISRQEWVTREIYLKHRTIPWNKYGILYQPWVQLEDVIKSSRDADTYINHPNLSIKQTQTLIKKYHLNAKHDYSILVNKLSHLYVKQNKQQLIRLYGETIVLEAIEKIYPAASPTLRASAIKLYVYYLLYKDDYFKVSKNHYFKRILHILPNEIAWKVFCYQNNIYRISDMKLPTRLEIDHYLWMILKG